MNWPMHTSTSTTQGFTSRPAARESGAGGRPLRSATDIRGGSFAEAIERAGKFKRA